jgi:hypothetical protein
MVKYQYLSLRLRRFLKCITNHLRISPEIAYTVICRSSSPPAMFPNILHNVKKLSRFNKDLTKFKDVRLGTCIAKALIAFIQCSDRCGSRNLRDLRAGRESLEKEVETQDVNKAL